MEHSAFKTVTSESVPVGRLLRVGALAAVLSASANSLVLAAGTLALMHVVAAVTNVGLLTALGRKA